MIATFPIREPRYVFLAKTSFQSLSQINQVFCALEANGLYLPSRAHLSQLEARLFDVIVVLGVREARSEFKCVLGPCITVHTLPGDDVLGIH